MFQEEHPHTPPLMLDMLCTLLQTFTWADKLSVHNELWPDIDAKCPDAELLMHVHLHRMQYFALDQLVGQDT